jgi:chemotaxis protein CheD
VNGPAGARTIGLGHWAVAQGDGRLACLGLGSCVAVVLDDRQARVGGMIHVVLPTPALSRDHSNPARFAETAVPLLIGEVVRAGAVRGRLRARLAGGASLFAALTAPGTVQIGQRNVNACRTALAAAGIDVVAAAVGGELGRSVWYDVASGIVTVRSVGHAPEQL